MLDALRAIRINSSGQLVVMGYSRSRDFPTTPDAWQPNIGGDPGEPVSISFPLDVTVSAISKQFDELHFSTFIGGPEEEFSIEFELDDDQPVVSLRTESSGLPLVDSVQDAKSRKLDTLFLDQAGLTAVAVGGDFSFADETERGVAFAGSGANFVYLLDPGSESYRLSSIVPEGGSDTRSIAVFDVNFDGIDDVLTGNYMGPNFLYLGNSDGFESPIQFGDANSPTLAIAVMFESDACIVEFVEDAVNLQYVFEPDTGKIGPAMPFSNAITASRDAVSYPQSIAEISAPDEVTLYRGCANEFGAPFAQTLHFPGHDLVDIAVGSLGIESSDYDDLVAADRNGGGFALLAFSGEENLEPLRFTAPPTHAVTIVKELGIVSADDGGYRYFEIDETGRLELIDEQKNDLKINALIAPSSERVPAFFAATDQGIARASISGSETYIVRLLADGSGADFATYLGGTGHDGFVSDVAVTAPGEIVLATGTFSSTFPTTESALQGAFGGVADGVIAKVMIGGHASDADTDGVPDSADNCVEVGNPDQHDSDGDGFGNLCDPDLDNNLVVNFLDLGLLRLAFFGSPGTSNWNPDADLNDDGAVNFVDLGIMRSFFFGPPGP